MIFNFQARQIEEFKIQNQSNDAKGFQKGPK